MLCGDSVPLQIFQLEASLPFVAVRPFEKYNFTTTHVCKLVINLHDVDRSHKTLPLSYYCMLLSV
jgi:hypothetical protein